MSWTCSKHGDLHGAVMWVRAGGDIHSDPICARCAVDAVPAFLVKHHFGIVTGEPGPYDPGYEPFESGTVPPLSPELEHRKPGGLADYEKAIAVARKALGHYEEMVADEFQTATAELALVAIAELVGEGS